MHINNLMAKTVFFVILLVLLYYSAVCFSVSDDIYIVVQTHTSKKTMLKTTGTGFVSDKSGSRSQAKLMARRAAIVDGYRNLLKSFDNAEEWIENINAKKIKGGFLEGAKILSTRYCGDDKVEVDVGMDVSLKRGGLKRMEEMGYRVTFENGASGESPHVITREEWKKLIDQRGKR